MNGLIERVEDSIRRRGLLRRGQAVLVAVSGGVDSMVLLDILHGLSRRHGWRLKVAHLNHRLRGRSSDADERLVAGTARKLGLPVALERADVRQLARAEKLSLEMAARKVRHVFLARTAARWKIRTIALAHHADDQLELFFLRLFRGSGGEGLAGMKWRNPSPADPGIELVRPLLDQPKDALREFAACRKVAFREDATNASPDIQRNRIRRELLPRLRRQYQPALDRTVLRMMEIAEAESEFIAQVARGWLQETRRPAFGSLPTAIQRRCIQLQLWGRQIPVDYELIERLRARPGCRVAVGAGLVVTLDSAGEVRLHSLCAGQPEAKAREIQLQGRSGELAFGARQIRWSISGHRPARLPSPAAGREYFDADEVGQKIILRHWQPGDRFQPSGMPAAVKLQDLFVNQKIARELRHQAIVATTASGELFWVEGLRISERFKLFKGTIRRLHWRWKRL